MIFIFGSARSGSTWLGKVFDSHPDLLYLHEPDIPDRGMDLLPHWFAAEPTATELENAKRYLDRLVTRRDTRTIGIRPFFAKSYRGPLAESFRNGCIFGTKALERAGLSDLAHGIRIPDLAFGGPRLVVKSVSALGRANAFLAANPSIKPILLIRHPCGFAASMMRGEKMGVMTHTQRLGRLAATLSAQRLGLNDESLDHTDHATVLAWTWLTANCEALAAIERADGAVLVYEDIASEPSRQIPVLFKRLGLGWPEQTAEFLKRSQEAQGDYYSVFRNSGETADRWRSELDAATIRRIRDIVERDPLGARFFDN